MSSRVARSFYKDYVESLGLTGAERVLEFGCGGGVLTQHFLPMLSKGGFLTCVDTPPKGISEAKERANRYNNVEFKLGDIADLDIPEDYYDAVSIHFVLHDISREKRLTTVQILATIVKTGGKLFIREPMKKDHGMPGEEIQELMKAAGLQEIESKQVNSAFAGPMFVGIYVKG